MFNTGDVVNWDLIYKYARIDTYNVKYENSLEFKSPVIAEEWDDQSNDGLKPSQISNGSHDEYNWICKKCGSHFSMKINARTGNKSAGCPECGKKKRIESWIANRTRVKSFFEWCLENNRQDLLDEWNEKKNKLHPQDYPAASNQKVWWRCSKCGNEWPATIYNRRKAGCKLCAIKNSGISIIQYLDDQEIAEYSSISKAEKATGISHKTIRKVLQGKQDKAGGYGWKIKDK